MCTVDIHNINVEINQNKLTPHFCVGKDEVQEYMWGFVKWTLFNCFTNLLNKSSLCWKISMRCFKYVLHAVETGKNARGNAESMKKVCVFLLDWGEVRHVCTGFGLFFHFWEMLLKCLEIEYFLFVKSSVESSCCSVWL